MKIKVKLAGCRAEIRQNGESAAQKAVPQEVHEDFQARAAVFSAGSWKPAPGTSAERARLARNTQRQDQYQQALALHSQGLKHSKIEHRVGISTRTIQRWLKAATFPETKRRRKRPSLFDPYASYVLKRWEERCRNGIHLYQEIKAQGYTGSATMVGRFILPLREQQQVLQEVVIPQTPVQDFSAKEAVWLFVCDLTSLDKKEQRTLSALCQMSETARIIYQLVQEFRRMLHARKGSKKTL